MKRLQSIACASLLTLVMSSATFAGNIYGIAGNIYGEPNPTRGTADRTTPGNIYGLPSEVYGGLVGLLATIVS